MFPRKTEHGAKQELPASSAHPFYAQLNQLLESEKFDEFAETACQQFYAKKMGRPSLTPGIRHFPGIGLDERSLNRSTVSRNRRLIALETREQVFGFVLRVIAARG